jgi:hypothetical protein
MRATSCSASVIGWPSAATMTSPGSSVDAAPVPGTTPTTSAP